MGSCCSKLKELRIVLIGGVNAKKNEVIEMFKNCCDSNENLCETRVNICCCQSKGHPVKIGGSDMVLVDTPGLDDYKEVKIKKKLRKCISRSAHHVFLFVLEIDRFTKDKREMVELMKTTFGPTVTDYVIIMLTGNTQNLSKDELIQQDPNLQAFSNDCSDRVVTFNGGNTDGSAVKEIEAYIGRIHRASDEEFYTHEMMMAQIKEQGSEKLSLPLKLGLLLGMWLGALVGCLFLGKDFLQAGGIFGGGLGGIMGTIAPAISKRIKDRL